MLGLGNDIIEIHRIEASIARHGHHFLNRVFTEHEQAYCSRHRVPGPHFAGRFAAKESVIKTLGKGFRNQFSWLDIEIRNTEEGQPYPLLSPRLNTAFDHPQILVSISHCREYAVATALWMKK